MTTSTGVIGLGALGEPIAGLLLKAGLPVAVYDVRHDPVARLKDLGATACTSPAEVARHSEIMISLVLDAAQTEHVVFGANGVLSQLQHDAVFAIGSTVGPAPVRKIADALAAKGGETLDIPISGGLVAARAGTLSLMVGGKPAVLDRALPVLRIFARDITRTGDVGTGQAAKLAHQLVVRPRSLPTSSYSA
jgi:2-hydroxy-3-oxopropionate reductase